MKKYAFAAPVLLISLILMAMMPSCKTTQITQEPIIVTPFSRQIINSYKLTTGQVSSLQLFNGPDTVPIVLKRRWYNETSSIVDGQFIYSKTEHRDSVIIQPFTKGKVLEYDSITKLLFVSFGNDSAYLVFGPASDKEGNYILYSLSGTNSSNKTYYGENKYTITSGAKGTSRLFFIFNNEKKPDYRGRIKPGAGAVQQNSQPPIDQGTSNKPPIPVDTNSVKQPDPNDY